MNQISINDVQLAPYILDEMEIKWESEEQYQQFKLHMQKQVHFVFECEDCNIYYPVYTMN